MTSNSSPPVVVALTGASGSAYAIRLLQVLLSLGRSVELVASDAAGQVMAQETGRPLPDTNAPNSTWKNFLSAVLSADACSSWGFDDIPIDVLSGRLTNHTLNDFSAGIASGSFRTAGMVICPCSGGTLAAIAGGQSNNLIHRAAEVHLKERRPLILVPRETPLSLTAIRNMQRVTEAGSIVLPASPGYYHQPQTIAHLIDFIVARICDLLHIDHSVSKRWSE